MKTRILSGLIMVPLLAVVFWGGKVLLIACFIIGLMGIREFYKSFETIDIKPSYWVANVSILLLYGINLFIPYILGASKFLYYDISWGEAVPDKQMLYVFWFVIVVFLSFLYLFKIEKRQLMDGLVTAIGIIYVIFFSFHVVLIDQLPKYGVLVWLVFITAFGTDIMAYFTGYALGKHKLCPHISPKKTIEGSIGGILGSVIFCGIFGYFVVPDLLIHCLIIGLLGGMVSQLGDLTASIFKRKLGVKDYGNLIPGHGGILDRFDSVLFTAPMVYYYLMIAIIFGIL